MKRYTMRQARAKRVNWSSLDDIEVAVLGLMGASTKAIKAETGFTNCQVTYRLAKAGIKRMDYRNGDSESFAIVKRLARPKILMLFKSNI